MDTYFYFIFNHVIFTQMLDIIYCLTVHTREISNWPLVRNESTPPPTPSARDGMTSRHTTWSGVVWSKQKYYYWRAYADVDENWWYHISSVASVAVVGTQRWKDYPARVGYTRYSGSIVRIGCFLGNNRSWILFEFYFKRMQYQSDTWKRQLLLLVLIPWREQYYCCGLWLAS